MIGGAILLSRNQAPSTVPTEASSKKADPFAEVKAGVAAHLSDPGSATFRALSEKVADFSYCGEVNAKNRMGGYVGYRKFFAIKETSGGWLVEIGGPVADQMCKVKH